MSYSSIEECIEHDKKEEEMIIVNGGWCTLF